MKLMIKNLWTSKLLLKNLIEDSNLFVLKENELIIHVRLGDVIEKSKYTVDEYLENDNLPDRPWSGTIFIKSRQFFIIISSYS